MKHVSSIRAGWLIGGLSLASLFSAGCLRDVGLGPGPTDGISMGSGGGGAVGGMSVGSGVAAGPSGVGGSSMGGTSVSSSGMVSGVGGSGIGVSSSAVSSSGMVSGVGGSGIGVGGSSSGGVGGGSPAGCGLGEAPVSCNFAHLNADCAAYGAVCDYIFNQCSCCFLHDELTCTTDADCESSFGASAFCAGGTCGCK